MKRIPILFILLLNLSVAVFSQDTYKVGKTEYYINEHYSTTGKPLVKRSEANKNEFLKSLGYDKVPAGYEVDHIIPLSEGGTDDPSNMQLLTIEEHARKTARERANRSNSTYNYYPTYKSTTTYNSSPSYQTTPSYSRPSYSGSQTIYTGPRGGHYYINSNGNKTYIKK